MRKATFLANRYHNNEEIQYGEEKNEVYLEDMAAKNCVNKEKIRATEAFKIFIQTVLGEKREFAPEAFHKNYKLRHDYDKKTKSLLSRKKSLSGILSDNNEPTRFGSKQPKKGDEKTSKNRYAAIAPLSTDDSSSMHTARAKGEKKKERNKQLESLIYDKHYLKRMLQDEDLRVIFLRENFDDHSTSPEYMITRLWLESMLNDKFKYTAEIRKIISKQLAHLEEQCINVCEMNYWYQLQTNMVILNSADYDFDKPAVKKNFDIMYSMLKKLNELRICLKHNKIDTVLERGKLYMTTVKKWRNRWKKSFKKYFRADLNFLIGLAYLETEEYEKSEIYLKEDYYIGKLNQMKMCKRRATENIGRLEGMRGNYSLAIRIWKTCYPMIKNDLEKCWILYQIGRCHLFIGEYLDALRCAQRSVEHAKTCKVTAWELNANILIASTASALGISDRSMSMAYLTMTLHAVSRAYICSKCLANSVAQNSVLSLVVTVFQEISKIDDSALKQSWSHELYEIAAREAYRRSKPTTWKNASLMPTGRNRNNQQNNSINLVDSCQMTACQMTASQMSKTLKPQFSRSNQGFISKRRKRIRRKRRGLKLYEDE